MKDPGCSISRDASRAPPRFPGKPDSPCLGMPSRTPMRFPGKRRYASGRLFTVSSQSEASAKTTKGFAPPRVTDRCQERPIHRREHVRGIWFTDSKGRKRKPETQERELKGQKRNFDGTRMERGAMATKGTGARRLVTLHGLNALQYWSFARCSCKSREQLLGTAKTRWADTKLALESASVKPPARLHDAPPECTAPLHVMITDKRARTESASVVTHLRTAALPPSSLVRIGPGVRRSLSRAGVCPGGEAAWPHAAGHARIRALRDVLLLRPRGNLLPGHSVDKRREDIRFIEKSASFQGKQAAQRAIRACHRRSHRLAKHSLP